MKLINSRGNQLNTEQCVENVGGNRFNLVLVAAARSREISRRNRFDENNAGVNAPVTALLEIQDGKVGIEYLKKVV